MNPSPLGYPRCCCFEQLELRQMLAADLMQVDLGLQEASIGGQVHLTGSDSCAADQHASGIANVTLRLLNEQGQTVQSAITNDTGNYSFTGIRPGLYALLQEQPVGLADAGVQIGSGGGQFLATNLVGEIEIPAGAMLTGYHFCESTAATSQNDGPPKLDRQGDSVISASVANVILQNRSVPSGSSSSFVGSPNLGNSTPVGVTQAREANDDPLLFDPVLSNDFGNIATRPRREHGSSSLSTEGLGSTFERVREAIVDELFDRVSWNAEVLRDAVVEPLSWLVPENSDNSSGEGDAIETVEASRPALNVAEAPQEQRNHSTEVR